MITEIENASEICFSKCGMDYVTVSFYGKDLEPIWRERTPEIAELYGCDEELTLQEIQEQFPHEGLMVICKRPFYGEVYRLVNCGELKWLQLAFVDGFLIE